MQFGENLTSPLSWLTIFAAACFLLALQRGIQNSSSSEIDIRCPCPSAVKQNPGTQLPWLRLQSKRITFRRQCVGVIVPVTGVRSELITVATQLQNCN